MSSTRQNIVTALDTLLKTIKVVNGYQTNAGLNVFEWRGTPLEQTDLPAILFRDTTDPIDSEGVTDRADHLLTVELAMYAAGSTAPASSRVLIEDVLKALGSSPTLGVAAVYDMRPAASNLVAEHEGIRLAAASLTIQIRYRTSRWAI